MSSETTTPSRKRVEREGEIKNDKELKRQKRATRRSGKRYYEVVEEAKKLWEVARQTNAEHVDEVKRSAAVKKLHTLLKGKIMAVVQRHDASRIVQTLLKHGDERIRTSVIEELAPSTAQLAMSYYGKFLVIKMLRYGKDEARRLVLKQIKGRVHKLLMNKDGAQLVEHLYDELSSRAARDMIIMRELYGPEYVLFTRTPGSVEHLQNDAAAREKVVRFMARVIAALCNKGPAQMELAVVHRLVADFFKLADDRQRMEMAEELREVVIHMLHSKHGWWVGVQAVRYGNAKDRKIIVRQFQNYVGRVATEEYGCRVLTACLSTVDDTVLLRKQILAPLVAELDAHVRHRYASQPLLHLLAPDNAAYVPPPLAPLLEPCQVIDYKAMSSSKDDDDEAAEGDTKTTLTGDDEEPPTRLTSRKEAATRRQELLPHVLPGLIELCTEHAIEYAAHKYARHVLIEVIGLADDLSPIFERLLEHVNNFNDDVDDEDDEDEDDADKDDDGDDEEDNDKEEKPISLYYHPRVHRTVRRLVRNDSEFASRIDKHLQSIDDDELKRIVAHPNASWIVANLLKGNESRSAASSSMQDDNDNDNDDDDDDDVSSHRISGKLLKRLKALRLSTKDACSGTKEIVQFL
jgi:pumilio homology domain family member 6